MLDDRSFSTARVIPFSPQAIYEAFASADLLAKWWGPAGFSNTFEVFEFVEGGRWKFVMHGPDGSNYPNESFFEELLPNTRVVIRHDCLPFFRLSVQLSHAEGGTLLTWNQVFDDAATAAAVKHIVESANEENIDKLTQLLSGRS